MPLHREELPNEVIALLRRGVVIPAHPLALTEQRILDERYQRALSRYYMDAGAGGLAVGVHSTQFEIRDVGLYEPVLRMAAETVADWTGETKIMIAGLVGSTNQAIAEADIALGLGYHAGLLSLAANMLPEFRAHRCNTYPILMARRGGQLCLTVDTADDPSGKLVLGSDTANPKSSMPATSVFSSIEEARRLIVDFYDAFAYHPETNEVLILKIDRGDWKIRIIEPTDYYLGYFNNGPFHSENAELDSIFYFQDCPYRWLPLLKERIPHGRHVANPST